MSNEIGLLTSLLNTLNNHSEKIIDFFFFSFITLNATLFYYFIASVKMLNSQATVHYAITIVCFKQLM